VLPAVPVRQWVLTVPHRLRYRLAFDHALCRAVLGVFIRAVLAWYRRRPACWCPGWAERHRHRRAALRERARTQRPLSRARARRGVRPPGRTERSASIACRRPATPTSPGWSPRSHGGSGGCSCVAGSSTTPTPSTRWPLSGLASAAGQGRIALGPRAGARVDCLGADPDAPWDESSRPLQARSDGFDLHGGVAVAGEDRDRLEQLCRYLLRPPIVQERLALRPDGRILVTLKLPWRDGTTHLSTA
jgi:hypothetical protein